MMHMWKFKDYTYKRIDKQSFNVLTGEEVENITTYAVKGYIAPVGDKDVVVGFSADSMKGYFKLPLAPVKDKDMIDDFKIHTWIYYEDMDIYVLELRK